MEGMVSMVKAGQKQGQAQGKPETFRGVVRRLRVERRVGLRYRGIQPCRVTRVYCVELDRLPMPGWALRWAVAGFSVQGNRIWVRRAVAKQLRLRDEEMGGRPVVTEVEYRRCDVCGRVLLAEDAARRRKVIEGSVTGRQVPCGPGCLARSRS